MISLVRAGLGDERNDGWGRIVRAVAISQGGATRVRDWRRHGGLELLLEGEVPEALEAVPTTFILASIAAFGRRYDTIVWPWNVAMAVMVYLLFYTVPAQEARLELRP